MNILLNNRLLVVDDNAAIHDDVRKILLLGNDVKDSGLSDAESFLFGDAEKTSSPAQTEFEIASAFQGKEGFDLVCDAVQSGEPFALAFVDVRMPPGWDGIETITRMWEVQPDLQVVICTAYSDYSWDEMIGKLGHSDNVVILKKPFDNIEVLQLAHALTKKWQVTKQANLRLEELDAMVRERTIELQSTNDRLVREMEERSNAQAALALSEERFSKAFQSSPVPLAIQTLDDERYVDVNEGFVKMTGFSREELIGHTPKELNFGANFDARIWSKLSTEKTVRNVECEIFTKTGERRQTLMAMELLTLKNQSHFLLLAEDKTERLKLEQELRQAQKMEAVGQLAAGIAHDFNNVLTIIQGHSSLHLSSGDLDRDVADSLKQIATAAERAANLTRQLLAFSRKTIMQPKRVDLNELIQEITAVLPRLIGEHIQLDSDFAKNLPPVYADVCNVEQILINLAVNARDAMPGGGRLLIRTSEVYVEPCHLMTVPEASVGHHVCLSVTDTGSGMDAQTRGHIFEPFFTTKDVGKGTGMGLATVYGIVKQHDGWIEVESEVGAGSTFNVFLPASNLDAEAPSDPITFFPRPIGRDRTVLVVEDDSSVRCLVKEILMHYRYRVLEAENGEEALRLVREHGDEIVLMLTDMVMPGGMSGREVSERITAELPDVKVIYTSGYSADLIGGPLQLQEGVNYLPKPYTSSTLADILRGALEKSAPAELAMS